MPYVGGEDVAQLALVDFDTDTAVGLLITDPSGASSTATPVASADKSTWRWPVVYDQAGTWVLVWTVTGAGANVTAQPVHVSPVPAAGGPTWRPALTDVAKYVPGRTLVLNHVTGQNAGAATFDETTVPSGQSVDALIDDAVSWVLTATGPIWAAPVSLAQSATTAAAIWAASAVERGYPDRNADVSTANDLYNMAVGMRRDLAIANEAASGTSPESPLLPIGQFPPPPRWADLDFQ